VKLIIMFIQTKLRGKGAYCRICHNYPFKLKIGNNLMNGLNHLLQKHRGTIILTISLVLIFIALYLLRNVLLPFIIAIVIAYILIPPISWIEKRLPKPGKWDSAKRVFLIVLVFLVLVAFLFGIGIYSVSASVKSFSHIISNAPEYFSRAFILIQEWISKLGNYLPSSTSQELAQLAANLGQTLGNVLKTVFQGIATRLPATIHFVLGFTVIPIFLFYLLKDYDYLGKRLYGSLSEDASRHTKKIISILNNVLGAYIRAQLLIGLTVGILVLIGLLIIRAPFAMGIAIIAGLTELVPVIGPWIAGGVAVLIVLAIEPSKTIWTIVVFLGVQLIENTLLVPKIHGRFQGIHPAIAIVLLIIGTYLAGFWGLILAVPLASTIIKLYQYVSLSTKEEHTS
jgi:predicted PurR-regulated permease PerM